MKTTHYPDRGAPTPWGNADSRTTYAEGIDFYSTPSHGGFRLSGAAAKSIPTHLRSPDHPWYEEDCESALVRLAFLDVDFGTWTVEEAARTVANWFPEAWAAHFGRRPTAAESHKVAEAEWAEAHATEWQGMSAVGFGTNGVEVTARVGGHYGSGPTRTFIVTTERYRTRGDRPFIVDPAIDIDLGDRALVRGAYLARHAGHSLAVSEDRGEITLECSQCGHVLIEIEAA